MDITELKKHFWHYLILTAGLLVGITFFVYFTGNKEAQVISAFFTSLYYIIWGIIHHALEERLSKYIALEYILVGSFVFLLIYAVLTLNV